jgi:hypothetical protein
VDVPEGTYALGLALGDDNVVSSRVPIRFQGKLRLDGSYQSFGAFRVMGVIIGILGPIGGLAVALKRDCSSGICNSHRPNFLPGVGIVVGTGLLGMFMALQRDRATITAQPAL